MKYMSSNPILNELLDLVENINLSAESMGKEEKVFRERLAEFPFYSCYEAGFLKTISWLYSLYQESGDANVEFLIDKLHNYDTNAVNRCQQHLNSVYSIRTTLQHSLDLTSRRHLEIRERSKRWFQSLIGIEEPKNGFNWHICLDGILIEAQAFLGTMYKTIYAFSQDQFFTEIMEEWNTKSRNYHSIEEFDRLISIVAGDLGFKNINPVKIRNLKYDRWKREFSVMTGNYDFEIEARKRIELALLEYATDTLPITGKDIIEELNIPPGPQVKDWLNKAKAMYQADKCGPQELILRLRELPH